MKNLNQELSKKISVMCSFGAFISMNLYICLRIIITSVIDTNRTCKKCRSIMLVIVLCAMQAVLP